MLDKAYRAPISFDPLRAKRHISRPRMGDRMITAAIFPGRYLQGAGAIDRLGEEVGRLGRSCLVI